VERNLRQIWELKGEDWINFVSRKDAWVVELRETSSYASRCLDALAVLTVLLFINAPVKTKRGTNEVDQFA
jgi:hypothetical protein